MPTKATRKIADVLKRQEDELLSAWMREQLAASTLRPDLMTEQELRQESRDFLSAVTAAIQRGDPNDIAGAEWAPVRDLAVSVARSRARRGFTASETAVFIFSFKQPLFAALRAQAGADPAALAEQLWEASVLLDRLGLLATAEYQKARDEVIKRQQQELLELSTPVVQLWTGILALPLIGTLDSARAQVVMESLLEEITRTGSTVAIIDITGVPTVDTLVAQHLLKTISAARLMGADCIISGIRPAIAQTIIHLGVQMGDVTTKATLADALVLAFHRLGVTVKAG